MNVNFDEKSLGFYMMQEVSVSCSLFVLYLYYEFARYLKVESAPCQGVPHRSSS